MTWITLTVISAVLLGTYDYLKKQSVRDNAVPIVLLCSVTTAALLWGPLLLWNAILGPEGLPPSLVTEPMTGAQHVQVLCKSVLVGASWTLAFLALKHLPLSIAGPIRSTSPLWTILIAVGFVHERPSWIQWLGILVVLGSFFAFSRVGKKEGIHFHRDRWVYCMVAATLLGSFSSIYDKYLLQEAKFAVPTLQAWFTIYLVPVMIPLSLRWKWSRGNREPFEWRWSIPLIAVTLLLADFAYFAALREPGVLVSLVSPVRRTSVIIPFLIGVVFYGEANFKAKAYCVAGLVGGAFLIAIGG